jgi:hypothetical protein
MGQHVKELRSVLSRKVRVREGANLHILNANVPDALQGLSSQAEIVHRQRRVSGLLALGLGTATNRSEPLHSLSITRTPVAA